MRNLEASTCKFIIAVYRSIIKFVAELSWLLCRDRELSWDWQVRNINVPHKSTVYSLACHKRAHYMCMDYTLTKVRRQGSLELALEEKKQEDEYFLWFLYISIPDCFHGCLGDLIYTCTCTCRYHESALHMHMYSMYLNFFTFYCYPRSLWSIP